MNSFGDFREVSHENGIKKYNVNGSLHQNFIYIYISQLFQDILTYVLMKILFLLLLTAVLLAAIAATYFIKKEQDNSIGNKFLRLIRKFDSWQMMR